VSATYEREKNAAVLKFYEPKSQKIILWTDENLVMKIQILS